jgi:Lar family restriction alleviation protein
MEKGEPMAELKPCPFCGGKALLEEFIVRKGFEACIVCADCLVSMPTTTYDTEKEARERAIEAWNKRTERPKGRWIESLVIQGEAFALYDYTCPVCSIVSNRGSNFCPNCGTDMRGESDE